jgi:hypothetical protein
MVRRAGLRGIGGDDFEVAAGVGLEAGTFAERKKGVTRATSGMDAPESGANAGAFFDEVDAASQIARA